MNEDEVVLGSSLESLIHSHEENIPLVLTSFSGPDADEIYEVPVSYEGLEFHKAIELWTYLKFSLSLSGLIINHREPSSVRLEKDKIRVVNTNEAFDVVFERCYLYQDRLIKSDLEVDSTFKSDMYKVMDFMKIRVGTNKGQHIVKGTGFIDRFVLFGSDLISVSYLTSSQLMDFDYSDTIVRFTAQKQLPDSGLIVLPYVDKEKKFKRKLNLEVIRREVVPLQTTIYKDTKRIKNRGNTKERLSK